jgi:hypothetical protein
MQARGALCCVTLWHLASGIGDDWIWMGMVKSWIMLIDREEGMEKWIDGWMDVCRLS